MFLKRKSLCLVAKTFFLVMIIFVEKHLKYPKHLVNVIDLENIRLICKSK